MGPARKVDYCWMGDGYTAAEMEKWGGGGGGVWGGGPLCFLRRDARRRRIHSSRRRHLRNNGRTSTVGGRTRRRKARSRASDGNLRRLSAARGVRRVRSESAKSSRATISGLARALRRQRVQFNRDRRQRPQIRRRRDLQSIRHGSGTTRSHLVFVPRVRPSLSRAGDD